MKSEKMCKEEQVKYRASGSNMRLGQTFCLDKTSHISSA